MIFKIAENVKKFKGIWGNNGVLECWKDGEGDRRPQLNRFHIQRGKQEAAPFALGYGGPG
jgi:hypothetical protein